MSDAPATESFPAARMDRPTKLVTFASVVLFAALLPPALLAGTENVDPVVGVALGAVVGAFLIGAWGLSPVAFELAPGRLRVRRRIFGSRTYGLTGAVRQAPATLGLGVRLGITGGMFGWSGRMWNRQVGRYRAHLTDRSRIVACDTDEGLVVISPADPKAFVRTAKALRKRSGRPQGTARTKPRTKSRPKQKRMPS